MQLPSLRGLHFSVKKWNSFIPHVRADSLDLVFRSSEWQGTPTPWTPALERQVQCLQAGTSNSRAPQVWTDQFFPTVVYIFYITNLFFISCKSCLPVLLDSDVITKQRAIRHTPCLEKDSLDLVTCCSGSALLRLGDTAQFDASLLSCISMKCLDFHVLSWFSQGTNEHHDLWFLKVPWRKQNWSWGLVSQLWEVW